MLHRKPKNYKVAVYFMDDDGVWHHHGTWDGEAAGPSDAKYKALDALSDERIEGWKAEILADYLREGGTEYPIEPLTPGQDQPHNDA